MENWHNSILLFWICKLRPTVDELAWFLNFINFRPKGKAHALDF